MSGQPLLLHMKGSRISPPQESPITSVSVMPRLAVSIDTAPSENPGQLLSMQVCGCPIAQVKPQRQVSLTQAYSVK